MKSRAFLRNESVRFIRLTTIPLSLKFLVAGQMKFHKSKGWDVTMVSADGPERNEIINFEGCPHYIIPMQREIAPFRDLCSLIRMILHFRKYKPHIIHTHTPKAGLIGMLAGWLCRVPVRVHTLAGLRLQNETGLKRRLLLAAEKITFRCAHEVWPNSPSLFRRVVDSKLAKPTKLNLIGHGSSNGIDLSVFSPLPSDAKHIDRIKKEIGYESQSIYLLCVGRIVAQKGIAELVNVFQRLNKMFSQLKLIIVGPREDTGDSIPQETVQKIQFDDGILEVGFSDDVKYYMMLADLLVHPSHREGFPNVPLQAGAMQCPVVCSDVDGNVDIVTHQETGLLFEVKNEQSLESTIEQAIKNMDRMKEMALNLRQEIEAKYSREFVQEKIYNRLTQLLVEKT